MLNTEMSEQKDCNALRTKVLAIQKEAIEVLMRFEKQTQAKEEK